MCKSLIYNLFYILFFLSLWTGCRDEEYVVYSDVQPIDDSGSALSTYTGLYLLNEGNMGSNHCTLDYLDFATATYHRNIYAERNPKSVKELGDVGNDLQTYGDQLWIVVNCSNKVEVCRLNNAQRLGQVNIPNCRHVTFLDGFAYVSSFVGPVSLSAHAQLGRVYKVDTLSLQVVDSVTVGYQPEEMVIVGHQLYVANSGGYLLPHYNNTVSLVDLNNMTEVRQIAVSTNPHRIEADRHGQIWVSTRGDYEQIAPRLYCLSADAEGIYSVTDSLDIAVSDMQLVGDTLWYFGAIWNNQTQSNAVHYGLLDVRSHRPIDNHLFEAQEIGQIETPYGLLVNPVTKDFYLMDAKNYVSSGQLLHFLPDGTFQWKVWTGDIPGHAVLVNGVEAQSDTAAASPIANRYIAAVDEYVPAPGQFVNMLPLYQLGDDDETMAQKCTEALAGRATGQAVTLGSFGGYLTFHFAQPVRNMAHSTDFKVFGNAMAGGSEPGIVQVSVDVNGNGLPDDEWYELQGSADTDSIGLVRYGYSITYHIDSLHDIPWTDIDGLQGVVPRNAYHKQEYFPLWLSSPITLKGTLLPPNGYNSSTTGQHWVLQSLRYGYVDNVPNTDVEGNSFDLDWAVYPVTRTPVHLSHADFIRVYCAQRQVCGWLGETSTEICGAEMITPSLLPEGR